MLAGHAWFEYALKTLSEALNHSALFSIQTNLWALDQEYVDLFARYRVQISTSLDGDRETTDSQRGEGYFNQTMRGVKLLMENGIAVFAAVAVLAQGGECCRMGGVVSAGKAAFGGEIAELGIGQPGARHDQHPPGLRFIARFGLELADANEVIQRWLGQGLFRSGAGWVGRGRD